MLLTLLLWIYSTVITFLAGDALVRIGCRLIGPFPVLAAPVVCLLGAAGLTTVLGWAWLVVPINLTTHLVLAGLLIGYAGWQRPTPILALPRWQHPRLGWTAVGILLVVVWVRSVQLPRLADTGGYHAPMIEWMYQYAIVPGLANLNYRFGFNNSWFLLTTFFRFQLAPDVPWHGLNGWIMAMLGWFSLTEWHRRSQLTQPGFSTWLGGWLAVGFLLIFHWTLSSPSPDLPTHVYVSLCFWSWLRRAETDRREYDNSWAWLLLVFSLSALTTKLSAVTILLLPVFAIVQLLRRGNWRMLIIFGLTTVVFTGYWLAGNAVLSGYIAYPSLSPLVDWFTVDWKVPRETIVVGLKNLQQGTRGDLGSTFSLAWVPYWFRTRPLLEQGIFVGLLIAPVAILWYCRRISLIPGYTVALLTAWVGVVFWFLLAPEIRFGAGSVLVALGLGYGPFISWSKGGGRLQPVVLGVICLVGLGLLVAAGRRESVGWFMPTGYPDSPLQSYKTNTNLVVYPTDDLRVINGIRGYWGNCYDAVLPCSPYPMPGLRWRGQTLIEGFRTEQSVNQ